MIKQIAILVALVIGIAAATWGHKFVPEGFNEAVTSLSNAAAGVLLAMLIRTKKGGDVPQPETLPVNNEDERQADQADSRQMQVPVEIYNEVVRKHNRLANALQSYRQKYNKLASDYGDVSTRFTRTRLNSRALRIALYLAAWESFIAVFTPRMPLTTWSNIFMHFGPILAGAFLICWVLTAELLKHVNLTGETVALRSAGLGCFACGFIACAVSLPYHWSQLFKEPTVISGCNVAALILFFSLLAIPITGVLGSRVASWIYRQRYQTNANLFSVTSSPSPHS